MQREKDKNKENEATAATNASGTAAPSTTAAITDPSELYPTPIAVKREHVINQQIDVQRATGLKQQQVRADEYNEKFLKQ